MRKIKNRQSLTKFLSIGFFLLIVLLGTLIYFVKYSNKENPDKLLIEYMDCIYKKDYEHMYNMVDKDMLRFSSKDEFIKRNSAIYEGIEAKNIKIDIITFDKEEKKIEYKISMDTIAGNIKFENEMEFNEVEGKYKIKWNDTLIFPQLSATDKVRITTIEANRGEILDRNGKILAGQGIASSVGIVKGKLEEKKDNELKRIAELLDIEPEVIEKKLSAQWVKDDSFVPIKTIPKVEETELIVNQPDEQVLQDQKRQKELLKIPCVMISNVKVRKYPLGEEAAHLIGYVQQVTAEDLQKNAGKGYTSNSVIGKSGMESLYEDDLRGKSGCRIYIIDGKGNEKVELAYTPVEQGQNIQLTIDSDIQRELYRKFKEDKSCSVAMNPYTGEVLALVSTPSYDNNDFILGMNNDKWNLLNSDDKKPMYNRFRQVWCPGSTFKSITAAIGLEIGKINPIEEYGNEGLSWQKDSSWGSYHITTLHTYKPVILENALIYSDNIYFAKAALKIGAKDMEKLLTKFGFNEELPFEIKMTQSQFSNTKNIETEIQLADSGYGQGQILINPLHLACIYSAFCNQGNIVDPYLNYQGEILGIEKKFWISKAFSKDVAERVKKGLIKVINNPNGTGYRAHRNDIVLAGKTGTAEIKLSKEDTSGTELGWFSIFTVDKSIDKPILIVTMVEDVKGRGGSGYVVKKDKEVLEQWFNED